jgi:hypothetical protein
MGEVFKVVDGSKGAIDLEGGRAEVKGDSSSVDILFFNGDGDPVRGGVDSMGEETGIRTFPEKIIEEFCRAIILYKEDKPLWPMETHLCNLCDSKKFGAGIAHGA